jgi:hypothetical protein
MLNRRTFVAGTVAFTGAPIIGARAMDLQDDRATHRIEVGDAELTRLPRLTITYPRLAWT